MGRKNAKKPGKKKLRNFDEYKGVLEITRSGMGFVVVPSLGNKDVRHFFIALYYRKSKALAHLDTCYKIKLFSFNHVSNYTLHSLT